MPNYRFPTIKEIVAHISVHNPKLDYKSVKIIDQDTETGVVLTGYEGQDSAMVYLDAQPEQSISDLVRGAVFAIVNNKCVIVRVPNPRKPTIVADSFKVSKQGNDFILTVNSRTGEMTFPSTVPPMFSPFSEGALVGIWKFRGKVYYSNNRALQYDKTKWNGCSHKETFERLGIPAPSELFPEDVVTDPRCHVFIGVDYHFITDSRQILTKEAGYIIYTGTQFAFDPSTDNKYFKRNKDENDEREYAGPWPMVPFYYTPRIEDVPAELDTVLPPLGHKNMSETEALDFIKYGFFAPVDFPDVRMQTGDSIHVQIGRYSLRIQPTGSYWRNQIRNHDPDVRHMVYQHLATTFTSWLDFEQTYMYLDPPSQQALLSTYKPIEDSRSYFVYTDISEPSEEMARKYEQDHALYRWLVFCNVLLSLSYQDQLDSLTLYEDFEHDRKHAIDYMEAHFYQKIYYADPEKYAIIGRVNSDIIVPDGKKYLSDSSGFVRDVTSIKLRSGQSLALLAKPHPQVMGICSVVGEIIDENRLNKTRHQSTRTLINKEFNKLSPNHVFQVLKQSKAWHR